ncbi:hypothetical protein B0H13DRAFT_1887930 [Mycena leptocephala]|nr:hypothetical protein B0H13DRAFT_1887930 [Mycena leptocephala]
MSWILPMYEQMLQHLTKASADAGLPSALRLAMGTGLVKLKHYYNKVQNCQFYVIAMILHPCLGLSWFAAQKDGKERMERAKVLFQQSPVLPLSTDAFPMCSRHASGTSLVPMTPVALLPASA